MLEKIKNNNGFTIVELLIVIVVIAILAAISIVAYGGIQSRSRDAAGLSVAGQVAKKAEIYYSINNSYPTTATAFNLSTSRESNLEGTRVTIATGLAPTSPSATTNFSNVANAYTQYTSGNRVIYNGSTAGYVITYLKGNGVGTMSNGTAPTGTYTFSSNENL